MIILTFFLNSDKKSEFCSININLIDVKLCEIFFKMIFVFNQKRTYALIEYNFSINDAINMNDDKMYVLITSTEYDFIIKDNIDDAVTNDTNNITDDSDKR